MAVLNERNIKKLAKNINFLPSKRLGQNFLIDKEAVKRMILAADVKKDDVVLEIGPGMGALTEELLKTAKKIIAVEKDPKMVSFLKDNFSGSENLKLLRADILKLADFPEEYKAVGSLPFYLASPLIRKFLEAPGNKPALMVFLIQKEVAKRITARPPEMSILSVSVQAYADAKIISYVRNKSFWPKPKVDSAIIKITPKNRLLRFNPNGLFTIVKAGFSQPRKQLINNLSGGLKIDKKKAEKWLEDNGIHSSQRAETLEVKDWLKLTESFKFNDKV